MFQFNTEMTKERTVVKTLILANIIGFLIQIIFQGPLTANSQFLFKFGFIPRLAMENGRFWQFITHMFLHGGLFHLFLNMFALYIFGSQLEKTIGKTKFLIIYFVAGFGAILFHMIFQYETIVPVIGASGAVLGIAAGYAYFYPNSLLLVFGIIPVKAWKFLMFYAILEFFNALGRNTSGIAHLAHFGGMVTAFIVLQIIYHKYNFFKTNKASSKQKKKKNDNVIDLEQDKDGWWK